MSDETSKPRRCSPHLECVDTVRAEYTLQALPPDLTRERKGRPARSPSLPPEEPKPDEPTAPAN